MAGAPRTILCYGDSNTHGTTPMAALGDRGRLGPQARWPGVLAAALGPGWRVIEEGLPGRTTVRDDPIEGAHKNGRTGLPMALESHRPLDLVILMLGTNDLKARFGATAEDIALGADRLLADILGGDCGPDGGAPAALLIAPPPARGAGPFAEMFSGAAANSARLGPLYAAVAGGRGAGFLDAGGVIRSSPVDGVHFDAPAHAALGAAVARAVRALLRPAAKPTG